MRAKLFFFITLLFFISMPYVFGLAVFAEGEDPQPFQFPGTSFLYDPKNTNVGSDIAGYIKNLYTFGLWIAIILAVGMIVIGAIFITVNRGSVDKESEGKSYITQAVWGLLLLFGSWLILNTVNPELIKLKTPGGPDVEAPCPKDHVWSEEEGQCVPKLALQNIECNKGNFHLIELLPQRDVPKVDGKGGCYVRKYRVTNKFSISESGDGSEYYDEDVKIEEGFIVWQYPYFINNNPDSARCIVYAYKKQQSGSDNKIKYVDLETRSNLQPCAPTSTVVSPNVLGSFCNPNETPPSGTLSHEDAEKRLKNKGIGIDSTGECSDRCRGDCTSLKGIPEFTINYILQIKELCQACSITITGGTEIGHKTHGMGKSSVDFRFDEPLAKFLKNTYIPNNPDRIKKICTKKEDEQYRHKCNHDEPKRHLHVEFAN